MIKTILIVLLLIIGGLLAFAAMQPDSFRYERRVTIKAPPEKIYGYMTDYGNWKNWSPWHKLDPQMKETRSGAATGVGSVYEWVGNKKVGEGRMEIIEAKPSSFIKVKLDFKTPFEAHNTAEHLITAKGDGNTEVVWAMYGPSNFMSKLFGVFMNIDKMVGKDFEEGLANLKREMEKA